ncbi:hypothetical protein C451_08573 [Halococcus thailandensis JCM 13552]|uniref:Uncharacterized protein n=1 Tax=Halococcus thailandensis JCM 13552 TaxID=1227457 RepID=M0N834_9EURY|nr:hypothetical protein C451_08573 [Halococcus thailandensis JCM 13552]
MTRDGEQRLTGRVALDATLLVESGDELLAGALVIHHQTDQAELDSSSAYTRLTSLAKAMSPS